MKINTGCFLNGCKCFDSEDEDGIGIKADREWQSLTDKQMYDIADADHYGGALRFARAIEQALKEKNSD